MHVIHELICGIRGAESGTVDLYRRGTSTRVIYYTSFEGDGGTTPSAALNLDTNGGGEFYVNETVDVVVRDSSGTEVRRFTSAPAASAVEVISPSFTGTDYDSAASGVSKPLSLKDVLDLWATNAGAPDWKVDIGGTDTSLADAFATVGSAFINVKASTYGAVGNGVANDTSAIQAALDAAQTAGGGTVYFPKGTYLVSSALTVHALVSLQGDGPGASIIQSSGGSSTSILVFSVSATYPAFIRGLQLKYVSSISTGNIVQAHSGNIIRIDDCYIGNSLTQGRCISIDAAGTVVTVTNSVLEFGQNGGGAQNHIRSNSSAASVANVFNCKFIVATAGGICIRVFGGFFIGNTFVTSTITSDTLSLFSFRGTATGMDKTAVIVGNVATNPTSGTVEVYSNIDSVSDSGIVLYGNRWGSAVTPFRPSADICAKSTYFGTHDLQRDRGHYYVSDDGAAVTLDAAAYGSLELERTTTGAQTINLSISGPAGMPLIFVLNNIAQGSGTGTLTFGAAEVKGITTFTVNANKFSVYFFRSVHVNGSRYWALVSSAVNL